MAFHRINDQVWSDPASPGPNRLPLEGYDTLPSRLDQAETGFHPKPVNRRFCPFFPKNRNVRQPLRAEDPACKARVFPLGVWKWLALRADCTSHDA
jgi:hypothetical protein